MIEPSMLAHLPSRRGIPPILLAFHVLTGSCGTTSPTPPPDVPPIIAPVHPFEALFDAALCARLMRCASGLRSFSPTGDSADLRYACQSLTQENVRRWKALRPGLASGVIRFDSAAGTRCTETLRNRCGLLVGDYFDGVCPGVYTGTVARGGVCYVNQECLPGLYCQQEVFAGAPLCPGTCQPRLAVGQPCGASYRCLAPEGASPYCPPASVGRVCHELREGVPAAEGQACGLVPVDGGLVVMNVPCAEGLSCFGSSEPVVCRRPIAAGMMCSGTDDVCVGGHRCAAVSAGRFVCTPFTLRTRPGETCGGTTGAFCDYDGRLRCVFGACASAPMATPGVSCTSSADPLACPADLVCRATREFGPRTCSPPAATGEWCDSHDNCESGTCAWLDDRSGRRCAARGCFP